MSVLRRTAAYTSLKRHIDATLGSGNLRQAVRLPPGEDLNEWRAPERVCWGASARPRALSNALPGWP